MRQTFDHLLGLSLEDALTLLRSYGLSEPEVLWTSAPPPKQPRAETPQDAARSVRVISVLDDGARLIVSRFQTADPRERSTHDG